MSTAALGDDDLTANGVIEDSGGPGYPSPFTVTTTADSGPGSLRQAILNANANPGMGDITFDIPGPGPYLIQPLSPLPAITGAAMIDGLAEPPGASGVVLDRTAPVVEIDGSEAGAGADGLTLDVAGSTVQGLMIEHFSGDGILIAFPASSDNEGDDDGGSPPGDNVNSSIIEDNGSFGIAIDDDPGNDFSANVVSGNTAGGISIDGALATGNSLIQNLIGTEADGTSALGNGGPGVLLEAGAEGNSIGDGLSPRRQYDRLQRRRRRPGAPVTGQLSSRPTRSLATARSASTSVATA